MAEKQGMAQLIGGGTSFTFSRPSSRIDTFIDLEGVGLKKARYNDGVLELGAMTNINDVGACKCPVKGLSTMLKAAAMATAGHSTRNLITIGGNCIALFSWSIFPVVFSALDASFMLVSAETERTISAQDIFAKHPSKTVRRDEILTSISISVNPPRSTRRILYFKKFSSTATEFSWLTLAARFDIDTHNRISDARIVTGALRPLPQRALETEKSLKGTRLTSSLIHKAATIVCDQISINKDIRCSTRYKKDLLHAMTKEMLEFVAERIEGEHE